MKTLTIFCLLGVLKAQISLCDFILQIYVFIFRIYSLLTFLWPSAFHVSDRLWATRNWEILFAFLPDCNIFIPQKYCFYQREIPIFNQNCYWAKSKFQCFLGQIKIAMLFFGPDKDSKELLNQFLISIFGPDKDFKALLVQMKGRQRVFAAFLKCFLKCLPLFIISPSIPV